jgi:glycine oxidase
VIVAAGHFRDGILLAPITGELVADLLARRRPRLALDAFDPARFLVRAA